MVVIPGDMKTAEVEKAIMICRRLGLMDLEESLWLVPDALLTQVGDLILPNQRTAAGGLA
jgi:hypothetical protein